MREPAAETVGAAPPTDAAAGEVRGDAGREVATAVEGEVVSEFETLPVPDLVRQLYDGEVSPDQLTPALRQQCVDHLTLEGYSTSDVASMLGVSERTVHRDRAAIRQQGALPASPELGNELLGEYQRLTLASIQRLTRLANDKDTPPYARLWAEDAVTRVYQRFMETARRLGYLDRPPRPAFNAFDPAAAERQSNLLRTLLGGKG